MRKPSILISYPGPLEGSVLEDIFLYLRPESNGVMVESVLMNVLRSSPLYRESAELVYLANLPGDFIRQNHVVESHYSVNYRFAMKGKNLFTPLMRRQFEQYFSSKFEKSKIIGSFEALNKLKMREEELFDIWVPREDMVEIHGQSIKKLGDQYIINYDIPALIHKNNYSTDIAVMILRSSLEKKQLRTMILEMERALVEKGIMDGTKPPSRYFHYSKGPFEQILDGLGYLYDRDGDHLSLENLSFARKMIESGFTVKQIRGVIDNPIMCFDNGKGPEEDNVFIRTRNADFVEALKVLNSAKYQVYLK